VFLREKYKIITIEKAKQSKDFWSLMQIAYESKDKHKKPIREVANSTENLVYAAQIKTGDWLNLNFTYPEFVREIYKALRLGNITLNEMATALLLHAAHCEFKDNQRPLVLRKFEFDAMATGPYDPLSITYATEGSLKEFYKILKTLPTSEQCYFSINFSRIREIGYLYYGLCTATYCKTNAFINILKLYIDRKGNLDSELADWMLIIKDSTHSKHEHIKEQLRKYIERNDLTLLELLHSSEHDSDYSSSRFLSNPLLNFRDQIPQVEISPDYDEKNSNSPLICMILPTISALNCLTEAMHGKQNAMRPYFIAGNFLPDVVEQCDSNHEQFGSTYPLRPVELLHPDIEPSQKHHGYDNVGAFILSWHDLGHVWGNSTYQNKGFLRYIRQTIKSELNIPMSRHLWKLVDLDSSISRIIFEASAANDTNRVNVYAKHFYQHYFRIWSGITGEDSNLSQALLLLLTYAKDKKTWDDLMSLNISINFTFKDTLADNELLVEALAFFEDLLELDNSKTNIYYILRYYFKNLPEANQLLDDMTESHALNEIISWKRNKGLCLKTPYCTQQERNNDIGKLYDGKTMPIFDKLQQAFNKFKQQQTFKLYVEKKSIGLFGPKANFALIKEKDSSKPSSESACVIM
jgi:hypothetical protein